MKKFIAAILMTGLFALQANANDTEAMMINDDIDVEMAWSCDMKADVSGHSLGLGVSYEILKGTGLVTCYSADGDKVQEVPVKIKIKGLGVGVGFSRVKSLKLKAIGIGVVKGPEALIRKFNIGVSAGFNLLKKGVEVDAAIRVSSKGGGFEIGMIGKNVFGLSAHLHGKFMKITRLK